MIGAERRLVYELVDQRKAGGWSVGHADSNRSIQRDDRGWDCVRQPLVQSRDALPIGVVRNTGPGVAGGDCRLQRVWTLCGFQLLGALEGAQPSPNQQLIPEGAVLIEKQYRVA